VTGRSFSVLSWNIDLFKASSASLDAIASLPEWPDVLMLQEVPTRSAGELRERLGELGYHTVYSCGDDAVEKDYGNVIASHAPLTRLEVGSAEFPWPELVAHAEIDSWVGPVDVVTVHVPNGSGNGWKKIETLEALRRLVRRRRGRPLVLAGDFNEPRWADLQDGHIVTWGQDPSDDGWVTWDHWTFDGVKDTGDRWDAAVRWFFERGDDSGLRHAYWDVQGRGAKEASHLCNGRWPRWFDHVFVSRHFAVASCEYLHGFREECGQGAAVSDHSAVLATLSPR
jgi:endonuclease/exonuclease/phosphatase family metal-dependent hydrolase